MYEDDLDNAEDIIYTGQGGHNLTGDKRQNKDQELTRGNLAMKVCSFDLFRKFYYFASLRKFLTHLSGSCNNVNTLGLSS